MHNGGQTDQDIRVLQRIIALMISLAGLCERLAELPYPIRQSVLWLLRPIEIKVRRWLFGPVEDFAAPHLSRDGDTANDAYALADRFLLLAQTLQDELQFADFDENTWDGHAKAERRQVDLDRLPKQVQVATRLKFDAASARVLAPP